MDFYLNFSNSFKQHHHIERNSKTRSHRESILIVRIIKERMEKEHVKFKKIKSVKNEKRKHK